MEVPSWNHFSHTFLGEQKSEAEIRQWSWQSLVATRLPKSKPMYFFTLVACQLHLHGCRRQAQRSQKMVENIPESPKKNPKVCSRWGYTYLKKPKVFGNLGRKKPIAAIAWFFPSPKPTDLAPPRFFVGKKMDPTFPTSTSIQSPGNTLLSLFHKGIANFLGFLEGAQGIFSADVGGAVRSDNTGSNPK